MAVPASARRELIASATILSWPGSTLIAMALNPGSMNSEILRRAGRGVRESAYARTGQLTAKPSEAAQELTDLLDQHARTTDPDDAAMLSDRIDSLLDAARARQRDGGDQPRDDAGRFQSFDGGVSRRTFDPGVREESSAALFMRAIARGRQETHEASEERTLT